MKTALFLAGLHLARTAPVKQGTGSPTVTIQSPAATIIGSSSNSLDSFNSIPFAQPPTGSRRLRPPETLNEGLGTVTATGFPKSCPQFFFDADLSHLPSGVVGQLLDLPLFQKVTNAGEDCLTLDIVRPAGLTKNSKLPVVVWIFGGGFELGSTALYNGGPLVSNAVAHGKPMIYVAINYRVGGFGFLPGAEVLADGAANLGLLDQRKALEWIADNIASFGGDPEKVTLWGESAGAISVLDQMVLHNGDISHKGKPLFRGAIMDSGSIVPADPVDCPKGQAIFDTVVHTAGCSAASDKLECLRGLDYTKLLNAVNSVPGIVGYNSVALSYLPRPDGTALTQSPDELVLAGKYAKVPFIIGDQEDEGTIFALFQMNLTTTEDVVDYFADVFFKDASREQIEGLVATYPNDLTAGSPFRTGIFNVLYPQYKRLAAILGDITFTLTRRAFLTGTSSVSPDVPSWSYLSSYDYGTPFLGTFHASDILQVFYGTLPNYAAASIRSYYYSFIYYSDPNKDSGYPEWPQWSQQKQLLQFNAGSSKVISDNFRSASYNYIAQNTANLHI